MYDSPPPDPGKKWEEMNFLEKVKNVTTATAATIVAVFMLCGFIYGCLYAGFRVIRWYNGLEIRKGASETMYHGKCLLKPCDEDGRCPVWSPKYSKCYMLDKEGERVLRYYEREGARKEQIESWSPDLFRK